MIGFKAFDRNLKCRGFQYEVGHTYELDCEPIPCEQGFHFCKSIADTYKFYGMSDNTRICKVEAIGDISTDDNLKYCTNKIVICEEIVEDWIRKGNASSSCSGYCNTGFCNSGNLNSGHYNSGNRNSGHYNTSNRNTGSCNTGNYNTGNYNTDNCNTGDYNTGIWNSGNRNTGNYNSGSYNTGDWNSGDWNSGNRNSGVFNAKTNNIMFFDKPSDWTYDQWLYSDARSILSKMKTGTEWINECDMTDEEKEKNPSYKTCSGYLKVVDRNEAAKEWWNNLTDEKRQIIYDLPNFDMDKFKMCVGLELE